jgi:hypothetical protein
MKDEIWKLISIGETLMSDMFWNQTFESSKNTLNDTKITPNILGELPILFDEISKNLNLEFNTAQKRVLNLPFLKNLTINTTSGNQICMLPNAPNLETIRAYTITDFRNVDLSLESIYVFNPINFNIKNCKIKNVFYDFFKNKFAKLKNSSIIDSTIEELFVNTNIKNLHIKLETLKDYNIGVLKANDCNLKISCPSTIENIDIIRKWRKKYLKINHVNL